MLYLINNEYIVSEIISDEIYISGNDIVNIYCDRKNSLVSSCGTLLDFKLVKTAVCNYKLRSRMNKLNKI